MSIYKNECFSVISDYSLVCCVFSVYLLDHWLSSCGCSSSEECSARLLQVGDAGDRSENTVSSWDQGIALAFPCWQEMEADSLPLVCNFFSKSMVCGTFLKEKNSFVWVFLNCDIYEFSFNQVNIWSCTSETVSLKKVQCRKLSLFDVMDLSFHSYQSNLTSVPGRSWFSVISTIWC